MNCFLIDFENVKSSGLKGIEHLVNGLDDVYIFYSDYANSITFDIHHRMNKSTANIEFFKSSVIGKNALDFQLISYLGYLIAQKKYKNYFVVTADRGFDSAVKFWKDFFKKNNLTDLSIDRFYNIQDALDKKSTLPKNNINKKVAPTIPAVETELELQQLKAEKIIIDRNSPQIEKHIEKNLNREVSYTIENTISKIPTDKNAVEKTTPNIKENTLFKSKPSIFNDNKNVNNNEVKEKSLPNKEDKSTVSNIAENPVLKKYNNNTQQNVQNNNNNNNNNKSSNANGSNDVKKDKTSKIKNNQLPQQNNKKLFNSQNKNINNNNNNKKKKSSNNNNVINQQPKNTKKDFNNVQDNSKSIFKKVDNNVITNKSTAEPIPSKSFVFGKVNINDSNSIVENIQKKSSVLPIIKNENITQDKVKETVPNVNNDTSKNDVEVKSQVKSKPDNSSKNDVEVKSQVKSKSDNLPNNEVEVKSQVKSKPDNSSKNDLEVKSQVKSKPDNSSKNDLEVKSQVKSKPDNSSNNEVEVKSKSDSKPKRKVGRPRIRPIQDESKKPKNNKKFQEDIPKEKLDKMIEKVSKLSNLAEYSNNDLVQICKIIAFSETKQKGYQAFMSYFGKHKGVEIYKVVKQEFDALKDLYLTK